MRYTLLGAVAFLAGFGIVAWGQPNTPTIRAFWSPPTTGTAVHHYVGQLEVWPSAGGDTVRTTFSTIAPDTVYSFDYTYESVARMRVAGVDSMARQGPYSLWSNEWVDYGPPGIIAAPLLGLEMVK